MKKLFSRFTRLTIFAAVLAAAPATPAAPSALAAPAVSAAAPAPAADEWSPLLDVNLSQWESFIGVPQAGTVVPGYVARSKAPVGLRDPNGVFRVRLENGEPVLRVSGEILGGLTTLREFANYRLRFQFRFGEKRWPPRARAPRDNGILYHCVGKHGAYGGAWMRSVEYQIQENDVGDFFPLLGSGADFEAVKEGKFWRYTPGAKPVALSERVMRASDYDERPLGEWNDGELVVVGSDSVHILNGKVVNVLRNIRYATGRGEQRKVVPLTAGKLQIQSEFAEVEFRRVFIKPETKLPVVAAPGAIAAAKPRVLVYSKTNGYRHHDAITEGKKFFAAAAGKYGFDADFSEDAAVFTDDALRRYDAIVLLCTAGEFTMDVPGKRAPKGALEAAIKTSAERREAFRRRIAAGTALVGLHAASDTFSIGGSVKRGGAVWAEYARIIGGGFLHHPHHQTVVINVVDTTHASTRHLPAPTWRCYDEWYDFKDLQRDNHLLLTANADAIKNSKPSIYEDGEKCPTHPLAWTRTYGKGRVFYTARGHHGKAFAEPEYAQHVVAGLLWALGTEVGKEPRK
jgi:type 1 glutamine amidotransferase